MKTKRLIMDCDDCYRAEIAQLKQSNAELLRTLQTLINLNDGIHIGGDGILRSDWSQARSTVARRLLSNQPT